MNLPLRLPPQLDAAGVLESTSDCVYVVDRDWRITYMNSRATADIAEGRDLTGANVWESIPELSDSNFAAAMRKAMQTRQTVESETYYPGWEKWFWAKIQPAGDGLAIFSRETTARRASEAALKASEERFRQMFETLTVGIIYIDRDGVVFEANPAAEKILGVSANEMCARTASDSRWQVVNLAGNPVGPEEFPSMIALRTGRIVRGMVMGIFNPRRRELRWIRIDAVPQILPGDDSPHQVYCLLSDITEQHTAEEALRKSRAHLAAAQRVAAVGSAEADFRTNRWEWSEETYRVYGQDPANFIPTPEKVLKLVHPDDREKFRADFALSPENGNPPPLEFRIVKPDGEVRVLYREVELFRDGSGKVIGGLATTQDITKMRAAEREREELQTQLLHAQRLDALGTLAGGIAHDLNNTLLPVMALTEVVQLSLPPDDPNYELLDVVRKAAGKARDLVRQVLAFSRQEVTEKQELDLAKLLSDTMPLMRASVPSTIRIEEFVDVLPPVFGDAGQLHQVMLNLVTNAAQAIGDRTGAITIMAHLSHRPPATTGDQTQQWICLSIADTGCGMSDSTRKRMFEPFFTTKAAGEGTGLGLSVVHGIITAHGGSVLVNSQPGKGTCIDLYLPCSREAKALPEAVH